jgi:hypothetical protein
MTETLAEKICTPCRGGIPPLARDEAPRLQAQAPKRIELPAQTAANAPLWEVNEEFRKRRQQQPGDACP